MPPNFDSKYQAALVSDIKTMFFHTEIGANPEKVASFTDAKLGKSTYSFGVLQFDVGNNPAARAFLSSIGFDDDEIKSLSKQAVIAASELQGYDDKLKNHENELQNFTNAHILGYVKQLDSVIDYIKDKNPVAAAAIQSSPDLQLSVVDYINQFHLSGLNDKSPPPNSMLAYLCGQSVRLHGGKLQIAGAPTVDDIQAYIDDSQFGQTHAKAVDTRMNAYNMAIYQIAASPSSTFNTANTAATPARALAEQNSDDATPAQAQTQAAALAPLPRPGM